MSNGVSVPMITGAHQLLRIRGEDRAERWNAKCTRYFNPTDDGLAMPWQEAVVWMNPPYSGRLLHKWMSKAAKGRRWHRLGLDLCCPTERGIQEYEDT